MKKKWHSKIKKYLLKCRTVEVSLGTDKIDAPRRFAYLDDSNNWRIKNDSIEPVALMFAAKEFRDAAPGEVLAWRKLAADKVGLDGEPWQEEIPTSDLPKFYRYQRDDGRWMERREDEMCWHEMPLPIPKQLAVGDTVTLTGTIYAISKVDGDHRPYLVTLRSGSDWWVSGDDIDGQQVEK